MIRAALALAFLLTPACAASSSGGASASSTSSASSRRMTEGERNVIESAAKKARERSRAPAASSQPAQPSSQPD